MANIRKVDTKKKESPNISRDQDDWNSEKVMLKVAREIQLEFSIDLKDLLANHQL